MIPAPALARLSAIVPAPIATEIPSVLATFGIDTPQRMAHFMSQCAHESIGFTKFVENLSYSAPALMRVFPKYFTAAQAVEYAHQPEAIGSRVYANRMGNGNEASGEGYRYRGRGAIQLTGRDNYEAFGKAVGENFILRPDLVATTYPLQSAGWYWQSRSLNALADLGVGDETVTAITRRINGGINGLSDRLAHFRKYWPLLSDANPLEAA